MSEQGCPVSSSLEVDLPESQLKPTQTEVPDTDDDDFFFCSIISSPSKRKGNDSTQSQVGGSMNDDDAWQQEKGHPSDSSSKESLTDIQLSWGRDYLWDQLECIIKHLVSNMPKQHPLGQQFPPPWAEKDPLGVVRDYVVAAIEKIFELGTAEGISEAQKGLVLQAKSLCQEQCGEI